MAYVVESTRDLCSCY